MLYSDLQSKLLNGESSNNSKYLDKMQHYCEGTRQVSVLLRVEEPL